MTHTFERLNHEPVYVKVSNAIEGDILSGKLKEGALLPTEAELCAQFGVTRSSVREGIRLLQQSGLVERGPAKRLVVKSPDTSEIAEAASRSLRLSGATFREVFETLAMLYPQAARLAADRLDETALQSLRAVSDGLEKVAARDSEAVVSHAVAFFQILADGLDNRVMLSMLEALNRMIGASLQLVIDSAPKAQDRIIGAQRQIIAALEERDAETAAAWMTKHIDDLMRGFTVAEVDLEARIV